MTYIVSMIASVVFFGLSEKYQPIGLRIGKNRIITLPNIMAIFAILVLSVVAGLRDQSIGTDVTVYDIYLFSRIQSYTSFIEVINNHSLDIGYELVAYISSKLYNDIHFFHFVISVITISGIHYFSKKVLDGKYTALCMFIFFCLFYNSTLNTMRQWIALSIFAVSAHLLFEKRYGSYIFLSIIALFFHESAIACFVVLIIYLFLSKTKNNTLKTSVIISVVILLMIYVDQIIMLLIRIGVLSSKYTKYIETTGNSSILAQVISRTAVIILGIILYHQLVKTDKENHFIICLLLIDLLFGCMSVVVGDASRFSLYFGIWQCVFIPKCLIEIKKMIGQKYMFIIYFVIIAYYSAYWFYCIPIRNFGETYPYISDIITWLR